MAREGGREGEKSGDEDKGITRTSHSEADRAIRPEDPPRVRVTGGVADDERRMLVSIGLDGVAMIFSSG